MRTLTLLVALSVFFSADAAEKKTNKGAFKMPKAAKGTPASPPADAAASAPPLAPAPTGGEDAAGPAGEDAGAPPASAAPATQAAAPKPELAPTAFKLPQREEPQTPEARSQPPAPKRAPFSLPTQKAKPAKKPKPAPFRLPQKPN